MEIDRGCRHRFINDRLLVRSAAHAACGMAATAQSALTGRVNRACLVAVAYPCYRRAGYHRHQFIFTMAIAPHAGTCTYPQLIQP